MKSEYVSCAAATVSVLSLGLIWQDYSRAIQPSNVKTMGLQIVGFENDKVVVEAGGSGYGGSLVMRDEKGGSRLHIMMNEKREPILRYRTGESQTWESIPIRELAEAARRK